MLELHTAPTPNGHKVSIALAELDLAYRAIPYDLLAGEQLAPDFVAMNPNARVPVLVDRAPADGGEPLTVFESGAILLYLAEKMQRLLPRDLRGRNAALQWLFWQCAGLGPMHGQAHHFVRYCPDPPEYAVARYTAEARRLLAVMERRLAETAYLGGAEYSIADIACWPWVRAVRGIEIDLAETPAVAEWYSRVGARPAVRVGAALRHEDLVLAGRPKLSSGQWSNLFGEAMHGAVAGGRDGPFRKALASPGKAPHD